MRSELLKIFYVIYANEDSYVGSLLKDSVKSNIGFFGSGIRTVYISAGLSKQFKSASIQDVIAPQRLPSLVP